MIGFWSTTKQKKRARTVRHASAGFTIKDNNVLYIQTQYKNLDVIRHTDLHLIIYNLMQR